MIPPTIRMSSVGAAASAARARLGVLAVVLLLAATPALAQIGVSPPRTEFSLDEGPATHTIRVFNVGTETVDIAVEISHWDLDEDNRVRIIPPTEQSLDQWLVVNPLRFTLAPGGSQAVRFAARPRVEPEPGEHRALMYFRQVPGDDDTDGAGPKILFRLGTSIIGLAGPVVRQAVVHDVAVDASGIRVDIGSLGNTHVRLDGQWALWPADQYPGREKTGPIEGLATEEDVVIPDGVLAARMLNSLPVLSGTRRVIPTGFGLPLEPGAYVVDVYGEVAGVDIGGVFEVTVEPPPLDGEASAPEAAPTPDALPAPADEPEVPPSDGW